MIKLDAPLYKEIRSIYGDAVADASNQTIIIPPFPMRIAWNINHTIPSFLCHKKIGESLYNILVDLKYEYGEADLDKLGINVFKESYSFRKQVEGNRFSTHAWGLALDLNPQKNKVKDGLIPLFSKPEYQRMIDIFYKYGWYSEGVELGKNWMHFQAVKYK